MKSLKKRVAVLMAAMVLCLTMGMPNVMTVKAAGFMPMAARAWVHCDCGTPVVVSTKDATQVLSSVKCTDYRHGPDCHVCVVEYRTVYYITCPTCGKSEKQNVDDKVDIKYNVHLDLIK